ncbi:hypothetical protein [Georgenia faecalis]|uniref:hypothetical protein n=1 Tax=Georgenia faecalis TaxID=2483799 RepID=UPI000FDB2FC2|nr:hypothetical protein [Georgenia faecalis]
MSLDFALDTYLENRGAREPEPPTVVDLTRHDDARVTAEDWVHATHGTPDHIGWAAPAGAGWVWIDLDGNGGTADTEHQALEELLAALMSTTTKDVR